MDHITIQTFFLNFNDKLVRADKHFKALKTDMQELTEGWISQHFVVEVHRAKDGSEMITAHRTHKGPDDRWAGGITWDELMEIKRQIGRADAFAVEVFPKDKDIIDSENVRHLWVITDKDLESLDFAWGTKMKKGAYKDHIK